MQLQAPNRPASWHSRAAQHCPRVREGPSPVPQHQRSSIHNRVTVCAADSSHIVVGYTSPEQYFPVADLHTACFHEPCTSPSDRLWHVFDRIWGLQVNASLARRGAGRCALLVAFDSENAPAEAVEKALAAVQAAVAAEAAAAAAAAAKAANGSSGGSPTSSSSSVSSAEVSSTSSNGSSSSNSEPSSSSDMLLPEEFKFPRYGYWLSRLVDRTVWQGLGQTHQDLGILGVAQLDTFGDIIPPRSLSPRRDGAFGWVQREGYAYISNVAVSPAVQRRGVARRLMAEAEALAASWGCDKAGLHVNMKNTPAVGLYRSLGYKKGALEAPWMPFLQGRAPERCMLMLKRLPSSARQEQQQQQKQQQEAVAELATAASSSSSSNSTSSSSTSSSSSSATGQQSGPAPAALG